MVGIVPTSIAQEVVQSRHRIDEIGRRTGDRSRCCLRRVQDCRSRPARDGGSEESDRGRARHTTIRLHNQAIVRELAKRPPVRAWTSCRKPRLSLQREGSHRIVSGHADDLSPEAVPVSSSSMRALRSRDPDSPHDPESACASRGTFASGPAPRARVRIDCAGGSCLETRRGSSPMELRADRSPARRRAEPDRYPHSSISTHRNPYRSGSGTTSRPLTVRHRRAATAIGERGPRPRYAAVPGTTDAFRVVCRAAGS